MTTLIELATSPAAPRRRINLERTYQATLDDVWALWTTKDGIESWWGPDGFHVEVRSLDLRPDGILAYAMFASRPEMVAFMKQAGMPIVTEHRVTYRVIEAPRRLVYDHPVDFVPGVATYDVETVVELEAVADGQVHMRLTIDPMHDDLWTERATMGWASELAKLGRRLEILAQAGAAI